MRPLPQQNFNPRLPCGRRHIPSRCPPLIADFNPRLPCGRRPFQDAEHFNPRLPCGRRLDVRCNYYDDKSFQSTPPLREATSSSVRAISHFCNFNPRLPCGRRRHTYAPFSIRLDFNPRLPCGRRPVYKLHQRCDAQISIHASLAGGDCSSWTFFESISISIHASLAGGDYTRSLAGYRSSHFNPRLPCGRRPSSSSLGGGAEVISIHASLAGGDARL